MVPNGSKQLQNGSQWVQMVFNGSKQVQLGPNQSVKVKLAPNQSKWSALDPNCFKWLQMARNFSKTNSKWVQIGQNRSKWIQIGPNLSNMDQYGTICKKKPKTFMNSIRWPLNPGSLESSYYKTSTRHGICHECTDIVSLKKEVKCCSGHMLVCHQSTCWCFLTVFQ